MRQQVESSQFSGSVPDALHRGKVRFVGRVSVIISTLLYLSCLGQESRRKIRIAYTAFSGS